MEQFAVEDLLDFPNDDTLMTDEFFDSFAGNSTDSSTVTAVDSCTSAASGKGPPRLPGSVGSRSFAAAYFSGDELCVPSDDFLELEWLSNFVEESFSREDLRNLELVTGVKALTHSSASSDTRGPEAMASTRDANPVLLPDVPVPGKARSKRSRAAPGDWSSRVFSLSPELKVAGKPSRRTPKRGTGCEQSEARRCLHCASEKTPQWRTGPMGPKTLCNACGVRYKSGRLVPEYRPASSPTFVSMKHSNSHRKVMELRRQKEARIAQHQQQFVCQNPIIMASDGADYLTHQNVGSDIRRVI